MLFAIIEKFSPCPTDGPLMLYPVGFVASNTAVLGNCLAALNIYPDKLFVPTFNPVLVVLETAMLVPIVNQGLIF